MAFNTITPLNASAGLPTDTPTSSNSVSLEGQPLALAYTVMAATTTGVFALGQLGPNGTWCQVGPEWTADSTVNGSQPARILIPKNYRFTYGIMQLSGTAPTACYLLGGE